MNFFAINEYRFKVSCLNIICMRFLIKRIIFFFVCWALIDISILPRNGFGFDNIEFTKIHQNMSQSFD